MLGLMVLITSFTAFDTRVRNNTPQSMVETVEKINGSALPAFLLLIAALGLPLGAYVVGTLAECEKENREKLQ